MENLKNYMDIRLNSKLKVKSIKLLLFVICCLLFVVCLFFILYQIYVPLNKGILEKDFIIEQGQGLKTVAVGLKAEKIIRSKWAFTFYTWLRGKSKNLQAGKYSLSPSMNIVQVANKIIGGEVVLKGIKVTIPEGFSNEQIEARLISSGILSEGDKLPKELEGYLFPDTYYFEENISVDGVVKKMRDNFDKKVARLAARQGKDAGYDILKMASILEKEVRSDEDRAIVSGIFWQRLEDNYPLESCATIAYILDVDKWRYSYEDTRIQSPYNTYLNIGLPPTPINNPGLSAIKAAINPQKTDYYFFLSDPKTGNTIFSKTFVEHSANKRKYLEALDNLILE